MASLFMEAIQTGILINQSLTFWERAERERIVVCGLVVFVSIVAFLQTGLGFFTAWHTFVSNFGNWVNSVNFTWADKMQSSITVSMAAPVQAFLIWRCWNLIHKSWFILVLLSTLLLASVISSIIVTVETFQYHFGIVSDLTMPIPKVPINVTFVLSLSCSAVLDVAVTGILLTFLSRTKQNVLSSRFRRILKRLTVLIWEAALPPCICAIMTITTYLTLVNENYWDLAFQAILGKLYVISLFVTLNGRAELQDVPIMSTNHLSNLVWGSSAPIRVDIRTDPESPRSHDFGLADQNTGTTSTPADSSSVERRKAG
ncbi:hypothetical protein A0H81_04945 [Grifola frondosa]|uniref:DUF6534 domain-containing protein n=1 Tax=Grifola frondosa TaxID=5627 RepID=A0A1C7MEI3_GRIFR|nr:hypothetical protein A0H81_04945 [Grifola frondosa]